MKHIRPLLVLSLFLLALPLSAAADSTRVYQGFSGGMMLHTGYLFGKDAHAPQSASGKSCSLEGATFGIGGALRINLWQHLRVGGEGFVSTLHNGTSIKPDLLQGGSYVRTGWGGVLMDACWRGEHFWPYAGGSVGGGAMRSLYIVEGNQHDWQPEPDALFHKQGFCYVDPYVGFDWCMTQKVHLTFRLDWLLAIRPSCPVSTEKHTLYESKIIFPTGPRLYVGFMFCH